MRRPVLVILVALAALTAAASVWADDDDDDRDADIKVAKLSSGRCGKLADSLPVLISRRGAHPGDTVGDVTVCVANSGEESGRLSLRALELLDVDPACTGSEATRDPNCGRWWRGELSPALIQEVGVGPCSGIPMTDPALDRPLPALHASSFVLADLLRRRELVCVRLRVRYEPADAAAGVASQSDRTTWRYAFSLVERR